jgi:hypothetical protein
MVRPIAFVAALLAACTGSTEPTEPTDTGEVTEPTDTAEPTDTGEAPIEPGTETVSASWDVDMFTLYESPTLPRFDTLGGRRQLDGMTIAIHHTATMTVFVENAADAPLSADAYAHEYFFQTLVQLGVEEETPPEDAEGPPFFGPGAFLAVVSEDLAAADGVRDSGPDYHAETVFDEMQFEAHYDRVDTERYLDAMTGTGEVQLVVGGFTESFVYWEEDAEGLVNAGASALQYAGTISVTYEYSPAGE